MGADISAPTANGQRLVVENELLTEYKETSFATIDEMRDTFVEIHGLFKMALSCESRRRGGCYPHLVNDAGDCGVTTIFQFLLLISNF